MKVSDGNSDFDFNVEQLVRSSKAKSKISGLFRYDENDSSLVLRSSRNSLATTPSITL